MFYQKNKIYILLIPLYQKDFPFQIDQMMLIFKSKNFKRR